MGSPASTTMPNINDAWDRCCAENRDRLGDPLRYKAVGAEDYVELLAPTEYGDELADLGQATVTVQSIAVALLKADVPAKPTKACRIQLPKIPGKTFAPVNVRDSDDASEWVFELETV